MIEAENEINNIDEEEDEDDEYIYMPTDFSNLRLTLDDVSPEKSPSRKPLHISNKKMSDAKK